MMQLIDGWKAAHRLFTVQLAALLGLVATAWDYVPALQQYLDPAWVKWVALAIIAARVIQQNKATAEAGKVLGLAFLVGMLLALPSVAQAQPAPLVGFSHSQPSAKAVTLTAIGEAKHSIRLAAYQYTNPDIIRAVIAAKQRGVDVAVILDRTQRDGDSQATMVASSVPCFIDGTYRIMHHKFMVIDGVSVETGSFNYTRSADTANAENALYLRAVPQLAATYTTEWQRLRALPRTTACPGGGQ